MRQLVHDITSQLLPAYPPDEAEGLAWWIMEELTGCSRTQIICGDKSTTNFPHLQEKLPEIITRLLHFEPIQYIFGHTEWMGLDLKVTPATLIPRPETAELVDRINEKMGKCENEKMQKLLDIGTGSGCIAVALKKAHPEWEVTGIDISPDAIAVAKENAGRNGASVHFRKADIFSDEIGTFDIIVSNPPYICEKEKASMRHNVLDYEPDTALFVPDYDPLRYYRRIAELFSASERRSGEVFLFFEINEAYGAAMTALLRETGYTDILITKDSYGKDRIIECRMAG